MFCPNATDDEYWMSADTYWPLWADQSLYSFQMNAERTCQHPLYGKNVTAYFSYVDALVYPALTEHGIDGMEVQVLNLLANHMGFNVKFYSDVYGALDPTTGQWSGFMGKVERIKYRTDLFEYEKKRRNL